MALLLVFLVTLVVGQAISIGIGLLVERHATPYAGLMAFIALLLRDVLVGLALRRSGHQAARAPGGVASG
jgi:hypothetical protein